MFRSAEKKLAKFDTQFRRNELVSIRNPPLPYDRPLPSMYRVVVVGVLRNFCAGSRAVGLAGAQGGIGRGIENASWRDVRVIENIPKVEPSECNGCRVGGGCRLKDKLGLEGFRCAWS